MYLIFMDKWLNKNIEEEDENLNFPQSRGDDDS